MGQRKTVSDPAAEVPDVPVTMDYSGPRVLLPFRFGTVEVVWTEAGHAHASAGSNSGHAPGRITYRGDEWHVSLHLYAASGWGEESGEPQDSSYRHQFTPVGSYTSRTAPRTYRAAIVAAVTAAVAAFTAAHPEVPADAEVNHLAHQQERAQEKAREAYSAYTEANDEAVELGRRLRRAREKAGTAHDLAAGRLHIYTIPAG